MISEMGDQEIVQWLQNEGLLKRNIQCIACGSFLTLRAMNDRDKMGWRCLYYGCHMRNHNVSLSSLVLNLLGRNKQGSI